jgi:hypothetical protein
MARKPGGFEMPGCEREPEVVRALARGKLPEDLLQHTAACPVCSEVRSITQELQHLLQDSVEEPLESAASVWWRLNLRMRRERVNRTKLPLVWMGRISAATILLVTFFALWQVAISTTSSNVLIVGLLALAAVALPVMIVLWRWSQSEIR